MEEVTTAARWAPPTSVLVVIDEQTQVGAARRTASSLGSAHGLSEEAVGRLALIVTEAATNIVRHARSGSIILRSLTAGPDPAVEMLALDGGPGIRDVNRAMRDGFSTIGTAGQGLGAIARLADGFEVYSRPDSGTAVMARVFDRPRALSSADRAWSWDDDVGAICVPFRGERVCGDTWSVTAHAHRRELVIVDGLGHGTGAAQVASAAAATFGRASDPGPEATVAAIDRALRGSRGAAVSAAMIDTQASVVTFSGVGNVEGRVLSNGRTDHLAPQNGIVGHTMPTVRMHEIPWPAGARLVLHSDGVSARWRIEAYPGLLNAHPSLIAGVIYRDFVRERDDATIIVIANPVRA